MAFVTSAVPARRDHQATPRRWRLTALVATLPTTLWGCNSILNSWLDPTTVGNFQRTATTEIRTSLTLEDTPYGIPGAVYPTPEDLTPTFQEYPITAGDTLGIEINELRQRQVPFQAQVQVTPGGYVNLPVVGRVDAAQRTVPEFEDALRNALQERGVLVNPEVTVNPLFLQKATYSIFGIGVSAAENAPLRAGTFPIRRPDLRVLEAINQVGGLNEFVTEVYVFRSEAPSVKAGYEPVEPNHENNHERTRPNHDSQESEENQPGSTLRSPEGGLHPAERRRTGERSAKQDLIDAVTKTEPPPPTDEPDEDEIPELLEPDPADPYIYVNKEFVPNPAYKGPRRETTTAPGEAPPADTVAPAVNWARLAGDTSYRVIVVPADLLRAGDTEVNIIVRAGDVIRIVSGEIGVYYVMGQVNRVGPFAFNAEAITVKAAIAAAGGLSGLAWPDRCTVYRKLGQREQMIQVNLDRIFAGQDPDFMIKRGDIINVGTHPFAPFLQRIRSWTLPTPVNNVGYSFTYARNFADVDSFSVRQNPHNEPDRFPSLFP